MQINDAGLKLIEEFEGKRLRAYRDVGGVPTIGYGHTGPDVHMGDVITPQQAENLLDKDLESREKQLTDWLETVPTTPNQFSALLSLGYNVGMGALHRSEVLENHMRGRYNQAAAAFGHWTKVDGVVVGGLVRRRQAERKLYETP